MADTKEPTPSAHQQLNLLEHAAAPHPTRPHDGDPNGLESIGSILGRWLVELQQKQVA